MTELIYHFPLYQEYTEAEVKAMSDRELAFRYTENNENTHKLGIWYTEHFCTAMAYDRDHHFAKCRLDNNDAYMYAELRDRYKVEIEREREARNLAEAAQDTIFMQKVRARQRVAVGA